MKIVRQPNYQRIVGRCPNTTEVREPGKAHSLQMDFSHLKPVRIVGEAYQTFGVAPSSAGTTRVRLFRIHHASQPAELRRAGPLQIAPVSSADGRSKIQILLAAVYKIQQPTQVGVSSHKI